MSLFDSLKPEVVDAQITTSYGKTITVPLLLLSWDQWENIGRQVPEPEVPRTKLGPSGKPEDMLPNPKDEAYLAAVSKASDKRVLLRLLAAMEGGGTVVPGNTTDEKLNALKALDSGVFQALVGVIMRAWGGTQARVETRAATFQPSALNTLENAGLPAMDANTSSI